MRRYFYDGHQRVYIDMPASVTILNVQEIQPMQYTYCGEKREAPCYHIDNVESVTKALAGAGVDTNSLLAVREGNRSVIECIILGRKWLKTGRDFEQAKKDLELTDFEVSIASSADKV